MKRHRERATAAICQQLQREDRRTAPLLDAAGYLSLFEWSLDYHERSLEALLSAQEWPAPEVGSLDEQLVVAAWRRQLFARAILLSEKEQA